MMEQQYALRVSRASRGFQATVLGHPRIGGRGPTREAAISRARAALSRALGRGEIVTVTVGVSEPNPWLRDAGIWKDDPQWEEYQAALAEYRREVKHTAYRPVRCGEVWQWSRRALPEIEEHLRELPPEKLEVVFDFVSYLAERHARSESFETMLASEAVLRRDWDTPGEDQAWAHL